MLADQGVETVAKRKRRNSSKPRNRAAPVQGRDASTRRPDPSSQPASPSKAEGVASGRAVPATPIHAVDTGSGIPAISTRHWWAFIRTWWGKVLAVLTVLALILGILDLVFGWRFDEAWGQRQPQYDRQIISALTVGEVYDTFRDKLPHGPAMRDEIDEYTRYVFILDNAYVQAFVDRSDIVAAYGVIMKDGVNSPPIELPEGTVTLGEDTFATAERYFGGNPRKVGGAAGAHHHYYYEMKTNTPGAFNYQNFAVGVTSVSAQPPNWDKGSPCMVCDDAVFAALQQVYAAAPIASEFVAPHSFSFFSATSDARETTIIDSVFVTAPTIEISDGMLLLHPSSIPEKESR